MDSLGGAKMLDVEGDASGPGGAALDADQALSPSLRGADAAADVVAGGGAPHHQDSQDSEEELATEDLEKRLREADEAKACGNALFRKGEWDNAAAAYTRAIKLCPRKNTAAAPFYANRAACFLKMEKYTSCVDDATNALVLKPDYPKVMLRRAIAYENLDKLEESLADYTSFLETDPTHADSLAAKRRLVPLVDARREKMKDEMMGNLKQLGNMFLKPFGLSTENFKMKENPEGGYSVSFE
mmetsp:Transcript_16021/g.41496  ORF Transcript_16021/g.41496 Transcript_16021/m.41496 type:complete len:242 (+) Transcript_16021:286-1011(+)